MTIEERFEMLEAELAAARRLTRRLMSGACIFLGMFVLFVAVRTITGVAHGQAKQTVIRADEIRAYRFIVEDHHEGSRQGQQQAILGMIQDSPGLRIGGAGAPRISLSTHSGSYLYLADGTGTPRIMLSIVGERPSLALFNRNKMDLVDLALSWGRPGLTLTDEEGNVLWKAP